MMLMREARHARHAGDPAPILARSRLLRDAPPEVVAALARYAWRGPAALGERLYCAGEVPQSLAFVAYGHVALLVREGAGREKVVDICGPGESFGEDALLGEPGNVSACVVAPGLLVHVDREAALRCLDEHPLLARFVLERLACKILQAANQVGRRATRGGLQRLAGYLLRHLPADASEPSTFILGSPKQMVASLLGLTKETFSRLLGTLARRGLIEVRGRTVRLLRPDALVILCHDGAGCSSCSGCPRGGSWLP